MVMLMPGTSKLSINIQFSKLTGIETYFFTSELDENVTATASATQLNSRCCAGEDCTCVEKQAVFADCFVGFRIWGLELVKVNFHNPIDTKSKRET